MWSLITHPIAVVAFYVPVLTETNGLRILGYCSPSVTYSKWTIQAACNNKEQSFCQDFQFKVRGCCISLKISVYLT